MDTREFNKVDLNLLIALQVLSEEKSVSRAAERLFITQPAMSKTLTRLRTLFDDALFTRSSRGMQPTPRAVELAAGLSEILGDISHLLEELAQGNLDFAIHIKQANYNTEYRVEDRGGSPPAILVRKNHPPAYSARSTAPHRLLHASSGVPTATRGRHSRYHWTACAARR